VTLWAARSEVVEHVHETSRNVAAVLVSEIARTVETPNNALVALAADLVNPEVARMDAGRRCACALRRPWPTRLLRQPASTSRTCRAGRSTKRRRRRCSRASA